MPPNTYKGVQFRGTRYVIIRFELAFRCRLANRHFFSTGGSLMAITGTEGLVLLIGRILFGGVIAFTGFNHFLQTEEMTGYAQYKGLPAPKAGVLLSGLLLILSGIGIVLGVLPVPLAALIAVFLVVSALIFHDFWAAPEEDQQTEMTQFLKNIALAGGALVVAAIGPQSWAYSIGLGLF